jgi:hypothetical protein
MFLNRARIRRKASAADPLRSCACEGRAATKRKPAREKVKDGARQSAAPERPCVEQPLTYPGRWRPGINLSSHSRAVPPGRIAPAKAPLAVSKGKDAGAPSQKRPSALKRREPLCAFPACTLPVWRKTALCVNHAIRAGLVGGS